MKSVEKIIETMPTYQDVIKFETETPLCIASLKAMRKYIKALKVWQLMIMQICQLNGITLHGIYIIIERYAFHSGVLVHLLKCSA